ncbi:MAG: hypothetical protein ACOY5F_15620 [Pseudomonadota bacterium]
MAAVVLAGLLILSLGGPVASSDIDRFGVGNGRGPVGQSGRFVVAEAFAIGHEIGGHAVRTVGFNFQTYFYPLVETEAVASPAESWTLGRSADDATLIAMIGGERKVAFRLSALHRLIASGGSDKNGQSNFAYARSPVDGRLWAIHWTLDAADEWVIGAVFVPHPDLDWPAGARFFAPKIGAEEQPPEQCSRARLVCLARP